MKQKIFYEIVLKNGEIIHRIPEDKYKKLSKILKLPRSERPDFITIDDHGHPRDIPWNMIADFKPDRLNWRYGII